jgi:hypothetical protein
MNKILTKEVSFELAKLLKEKGYDELCGFVYNGQFEPFHTNKITECGYLQTNSELINLVYSAPTIGEVFDWIYDKHKIWISVNKEVEGFDFIIDNKYGLGKYQKRIDSPAEAYEEAIKNVLINN